MSVFSKPALPVKRISLLLVFSNQRCLVIFNLFDYAVNNGRLYGVE
jgi:hypothetical protein